MQIETVADYPCGTGENPLWHPDEQRLYWTDIPSGVLYWYDPATGEHQRCYEGRPVGGFTIQPDGDLLLFRDKGNVVTWRDGEEKQTVLDEIPDERETRFNDVFADPRGRVFCGTMPTADRKGRLYRLDRDGGYEILLEGIGTPNGMGLTLDGRGFYFTDTKAQTIWLFDYDEATGGITRQRTFASVPKDLGGPDGMTVDANGDVWSAHFRGWCLTHYAPDGSVKERIEMPAANLTSVMFAGPALDELYVTSASGDKRPDAGEHAGALFRLKPGVKGRAEHRSRIGQ